MIDSPKCKVCQHQNRIRIELAMIKGVSNQKLQDQFGPGRMSMQRHREQHLPGRIREDAEEAGALEPGAESNLWDALSALDADLQRNARKAERKGNHAAAVSAIKERKAIAELKARARGELLPEPTAGRDMTLIVAMDADAAERALTTWAQRRGGQGALPATPSAAEEPEPIEAEAVKGDA